MSTKKIKLTPQQEANKKEYIRLRENLKARERRLLNSGYYIKPSFADKIHTKTVTQLGHNPRKSDIKRLKNISKNIFGQAFHKTFYSETGEAKEFSLNKARNIERSQAAKKAAKTRELYKTHPEFKEFDKKRKQGSRKNTDFDDNISTPKEDKSEIDITVDDNETESGVITIDGENYFLNEDGELIPIEVNSDEVSEDFDEEYYTTNDLPFNESPNDDFPEQYKLPMTTNDNIDTVETSKTTLEQDITLANMEEVLNTIKYQIMKLYGFRSDSKNKSKQEANEQYVSEKADIIMDKFMELIESNKAELANNCQTYAMQITSLIDSVKYSYRDPRSFDAIFTDLINYFVGTPSFSEESAIFAESDFNYEVGGDYIYE